MDGLISALREISPLVSSLIDLAYQAGLLLLAFWLGKLALKGYRKKLNLFFKTLVSVFVGFLIYITSKPIIKTLPIKIPFLTDFLALFIPVFVFYLSFLLIFEKKEMEYVSIPTIKRLERLVDTLAEKIERINKGVGIGKLDFTFFKQQVDSKLKEIGVEDYDLKTRKRENSFYIIRAVDHKASYKFKFNVVSGRLEKFEKKGFPLKKRIRKFFPYLLRKKKKLVGILILTSFVTLTLLNYPGGILKVNLKNMTPLGTEEEANITTGCVGPLELYKNKEEIETVEANFTREDLVSWINETEEEEFQLLGFTNQSFSYQKQNYTLVFYAVGNQTSSCSANLNKEKICKCIKKQEIGPLIK